MINWGICGRQWSWPTVRYLPTKAEENHLKTSVGISGGRAETGTRDLPDMKQVCDLKLPYLQNAI
jgi:hypothetical protein